MWTEVVFYYDGFYTYAELGKLLYESNSYKLLHITGYFHEEVIYYSYILASYSIKKVTPLYYYYFQK